MSRGYDLARLIRTGAPTFATAQAVRDMAVYYGTPPAHIRTACALVEEDNGGGNWTWIADSLEDDCTGMVLELTGWVGAGRYHRDASPTSVKFNWFGGLADSTTPNDTAMDLLLAYRKSLPTQQTLEIVIPPSGGDNDGDQNYYLFEAPVTIDSIADGLSVWEGKVVIKADGATLRWVISTAEDFCLHACGGNDGASQRPPIFEVIGGRWVSLNDTVETLFQITDLSQVRFRRITALGSRAKFRPRILDKSTGVENFHVMDSVIQGTGPILVAEGPSVTGGTGAESMARLVFRDCFIGGTPNPNIAGAYQRFAFQFTGVSAYHCGLLGLRGNIGGFTSLAGFEGGADYSGTEIRGIRVEVQPDLDLENRAGDRSGTCSSDGTSVTITSAGPLAGTANAYDQALVFRAQRDIDARISFIAGAVDGTDIHTWISGITSTTECTPAVAPYAGWSGETHLHGMYIVRTDERDIRLQDIDSIGVTQWSRWGKAFERFASVRSLPVDYRGIDIQLVSQISTAFGNSRFERIATDRVTAREIVTPYSAQYGWRFTVTDETAYQLPDVTQSEGPTGIGGRLTEAYRGFWEIILYADNATNRPCHAVFLVDKHTDTAVPEITRLSYSRTGGKQWKLEWGATSTPKVTLLNNSGETRCALYIKRHLSIMNTDADKVFNDAYQIDLGLIATGA